MTNILVVDSNPATGFHLKKLFSEYHIEFSTATSGSEAINRLHRQFDIIIIDINLGIDDGFEVIQKINEHATTAMIIIATSTNTRKAFVRGIRLGASDYILKPYEDTYIKGKILNHIRELKEAENIPSAASVDNLIYKHLEKAVMNKTEMIVGIVMVYSVKNPTLPIRKNALIKGFFNHIDKAVYASELLDDSMKYFGETADYAMNGKIVIIDAVKLSDKENIVQSIKRIANETLDTSEFSYEIEFMSLPHELNADERVLETLNRRIEGAFSKLEGDF